MLLESLWITRKRFRNNGLETKCHNLESFLEFNLSSEVVQWTTYFLKWMNIFMFKTCSRWHIYLYVSSDLKWIDFLYHTIWFWNNSCLITFSAAQIWLMLCGCYLLFQKHVPVTSGSTWNSLVTSLRFHTIDSWNWKSNQCTSSNMSSNWLSFGVERAIQLYLICYPELRNNAEILWEL